MGPRESRQCHAGWHGGAGHDAGAGATAELIREERRIRFRPRGKPNRVRKRFGQTTAGPDGTVALGIPDGAAPTMRHSQGEVRWYVRVSAGGGVAEVELNVFNAA